MHSLRVALLGAGNICRTMHIPYLKSLGVDVVFAVDLDPYALDFVASKFRGIETAHTIPPADEMNVDCAIISSPNALHFEHSRTLLERGVHVLCEKPLACVERDARELANISKRNGVVLQVGYYRRFHPSASVINALIENTELGELQEIRMYAGGVIRSGDLSPAFFDRRLSCGGVLIDFGVHLIDRLYSWFERLELVSYQDDSQGGVEANAHVRLLGDATGVNKSGKKSVPISITLSRTNEVGNFTLIKFEGMDVKVEHNVGHLVTLIAKEEKRILEYDIALSSVLKVGEEKPIVGYFKDQFIEFTKRIDGEQESRSSLDDAMRVNGIVDRCYSARQELTLTWEKQVWNEFR